MTFETFFLKNLENFSENLEMTDIVGGGGGGSCYVSHYEALRTKIDMLFIHKLPLQTVTVSCTNYFFIIIKI